jgi:hypothetical protein
MISNMRVITQHEVNKPLREINPFKSPFTGKLPSGVGHGILAPNGTLPE